MSFPDPFTPADCDLRGYEYMPLFGQRLFGSELYMQCSAEEFRAAIRLWWSAWQQCPAGSLPAADAAQAMMADYGRDLKGWAKVKDAALRGFVMCSDGRLYHPVLAEAAVKAFDLRLKSDTKRAADRKRLQDWRDSKKPREDDGGGNDEGSGDETRFTDVSETPNEACFETPNVGGRREVEEKRREKEKKESRSLRSLVRSKAAKADPAFAEFYEAYPRHEAPDDGLKAWRSALSAGAQPADIMAGLKRHRFNGDPQYIPLPASWLRAGRWKDEPLQQRIERVQESPADRRIRQQREALFRLAQEPDALPFIDNEPDFRRLQ